MAVYSIAAMRRGSTALDGLQSASFDPGINEFINGSDGSVYNTFGAVNQIAPKGQFNSFHIKKFIDLIGTSGLEIGETPLDMWLQQRKHGSTYETTGEKISITKGLIIPVTLSANAGSEATLSGEIVAGGSTGTVPYTVTSGESVPTSPAATLSEMFKLGPCKINSTEIGEVQSSSVSFGIEVKAIFNDGSIYPNGLYVVSIKPTITISTFNAAQLSGLTVDGASNDVTVQFNKLVKGAAEAASGHMVISAASARIKVNSAGGSHGDDAAVEISVTPIFNGTDAPLVISYTGS